MWYRNESFFSMVFLFCFVFLFLGPQVWHLEVLRLGIELKLQPPAYAAGAAMPHPSQVSDQLTATPDP